MFFPAEIARGKAGKNVIGQEMRLSFAIASTGFKATLGSRMLRSLKGSSNRPHEMQVGTKSSGVITKPVLSKRL